MMWKLFMKEYINFSKRKEKNKCGDMWMKIDEEWERETSGEELKYK